ncbi:MAG: molybdopterin-binding protein, partial [Deltaproteobacteria bacterium]|nr:molybdopterin-binding protein [Deltaproteobacteria bacterium]
GLLSSLGLGGVDLFLRPRVGLLMSGNEVVPPGGPPLPAGVVDAVSPMLAGLIRRDGGEVAAVAHLPDDRGSQARALAQTPGDILLAVGGTSVGREDHLPTLVADQGRLLVHGVAIRPGSPMGFGLAPDGGGRQRPVFLLPGNPVAALVGYDFFAGPLLRRMGGRPAGWPYSSVEAVLTQRVLGSIGQVDYVRVMIEPRRGALESRRGALESRRGAGAVPWLATPLAHGGAGRLSTTTRADGFVVAGHHSEGWPQGGRAPVWLYDPLPVADAPWIEEEDR